MDSAAAALLRSSSITHLDKQPSLTSLLKLAQSPTHKKQRRPSYENSPNKAAAGHYRKKSKTFEKELAVWRERVGELEQAVKEGDQARAELQRQIEVCN